MAHKIPCKGCKYSSGEVKPGVVRCELLGGCVLAAEPPTHMRFDECAYRMWERGTGAIFDIRPGQELIELRRKVLAGTVSVFDYGKGVEEHAYA